MDYNTQKSANEIYLLLGSFNLENIFFWPLGPTGSITTDFTDVHEKFGQKRHWNSESPKFMDYSTLKSVIWGIYLLWGLLDHQNGPFWPSRPTGSIANIIMNVHKKFRQKRRQNSLSPKRSWAIAYENRQNEMFTWSGARLTFKMDSFGR